MSESSHGKELLHIDGQRENSASRPFLINDDLFAIEYSVIKTIWIGFAEIQLSSLLKPHNRKGSSAQPVHTYRST
jgi:hypothetical protein